MTSKEYCKCPYCGSECEVDTSMILASNPPQYQAFCKKCNKMIYTLCSDAYGEVSINQENNFIEKDAEYHKDIHRIADALEKIAKSLGGEEKQQLKTTDAIRCPKCGSYKISYLLTNPNEPDRCRCNDCGATWEEKYNIPITTSPSPSVSNSCEGCWYYQQLKANPNPTITIGDTPCSWCPKMQPICEAINNDR